MDDIKRVNSKRGLQLRNVQTAGLSRTGTQRLLQRQGSWQATSRKWKQRPSDNLVNFAVSRIIVRAGKLSVTIYFPVISFGSYLKDHFRFLHDMRVRIAMGLCAALVIFAEVVNIIQPFLIQHTYTLGSAGSLLLPISQPMADKLKYDSQQAFNFNASYNSYPSGTLGNNGSQIVAVAYQNPSKGVAVTDPVNNVDFTLAPEFNLLPGQQDGNRIVYPLSDNSGWAVYSMHSVGVKEDLLLNRADRDKMTFDYNLSLGDGLVGRTENDGSIGVYGNTTLSGDVATSTEKDAVLLQKARQNAPKNTLLFHIPAPTIHELGTLSSTVNAAYLLKGNKLTVAVSGLKSAHYPLTIDPSIYVETAEKFMRGNNETNIDFDVADTLIQKGKTTGARFNSWNATQGLNTSAWRQGTAVAGGYIYAVGGNLPSGLTTTFSTQGTASYVVPSGITSITVKMWGGGAGGGAGGASTTGGDGGGAGYVSATYTVTPGETLTVYVGGAGAGATSNTSGGGGGGGGYSSLYRSTTPLAIAAGGGGGGGGRTGTDVTQTGGAGGAGGGTTGATGSVGGGAATTTGGGGGTQSAGGAGGTVTSSGNNGSAGSSLAGGAGADGRTGSGTDGSGAAGGLATGGAGGSVASTSRGGGGGGGSGYFGGGGGSGSQGTSTGASGGGGGSSFTAAGATSVTNTAGSGTAPGNSGDPDRAGAGSAGSGGAAAGSGVSGTNGKVMIFAGSGSTNTATVSWAKFNITSGTVDSPNPGNGTCTGWCTTSAYDLPTARNSLTAIAYNGFLYAIGGEDSSCTTGNGTGDGGVCKTVYIAKLGANGEPQLWHPSDTNKSNWVYWYRDTDLSSPRSFTGAIAYNNRMYLLGGKTSSGSVAALTNSTQIADITPTGVLGSWSTSTSLPKYSYGHAVQAYNDRLYIVGGDSNTSSTISSATLTNAVYYIKVNSDGTLNSWVQTTSFATARMTNGGNFTAVWGAYIYLSGGCSTVNGSGYCTAIASDSQLASINADGSLDVWNTNASVSDARMGYNLVAWRSIIYELGGCSTQNATTGDCSSALTSVKYGAINQDGDASTVDTSVPSGTSPCSGTTPSGCDLPGTTFIGNMLNATAIYNGYLYLVGGVVSCNGSGNSCLNTTGNVAYVAIASTGEMIKPATCPGGTYQTSWCVDTTDVITGGIAAAGTVVFGGNIYVIGGLNGTNNKGNLYYVSLNTDGSLAGAWNSQTMASVGMASVAFEYAYARSNPGSAGSNPGNLYVLGGCTATSGVGCTTYSDAVYKCNITTTGAVASCSTTANGTQLQIGSIPGGCGTGLGAMAGAVYANYIYLIGGLTPNCTDLKTVRYAKFDNNNNIVAVSGSAWIESANQTQVGRRRGSGFSYNGYIYVVGGYDGTSGGGVLHDIEFSKIDVSSGDIGVFTTSAVAINQRWGLSVPVSNSFAYVIGGCTNGNSPDCNTRTDTIQTFQIYNNDSGTPAGYSSMGTCTGASTGPCPGANGVDRIGASATVLNGYIYYAGGCTNIGCTAFSANTYYAPIDANGTIGAWSTGGSLPTALAWGKLEAVGGTLYYMGGQTGNAVTTAVGTVYYTSGISSGNPTWNGTAATKGIGNVGSGDQARTQFGSAVWNNRLYIVGGFTGASGTAVSAVVYSSPQLSSGGNITGNWTTASTSPSNTSFNVARSGLTVITYANNLYLFGGFDGTNYLNDSQYAQISTSDGTIGSWSYSTSLPTSLRDAEGFAANGYMYIIGGRSASTSCRPITLAAPISANTTIASGNNPTGIGEWYETNQRYAGDRYGAAAVYNDGKAYVIGGGCSSFVGASDRTYATSLLSQPQVAKYSIMFDTDSDVFPNMWLLNGVDNSIGANWQLSYRSMSNTTSCTSPAMTTWGQVTNFGNVTLGTPGVYIPKNGSGTNMNCARFYYFLISVDSSQAYGYPDDVSRGPTITDLTLEFTADPSKRLMHGRTFVGGLQQPDDTPCHQSNGANYSACPLP